MAEGALGGGSRSMAEGALSLTLATMIRQLGFRILCPTPRRSNLRRRTLSSSLPSAGHRLQCRVKQVKGQALAVGAEGNEKVPPLACCSVGWRRSV